MKYKVHFKNTIPANDGTQIGSFEIPDIACVSADAGLVKFTIPQKPAFFLSAALIVSILPVETEVFDEAVEKTKEQWNRSYTTKQNTIR